VRRGHRLSAERADEHGEDAESPPHAAQYRAAGRPAVL
jgi:hypothetical protein